ncbi:response regulator [Mucilaginibacter conchicola]|uniref:Response regulator n=1 Tax=Mucilaginibacter conchicola TaxID=2303333 RepID=A0A372NPQ3_9SPHI|nr:response regulator [Mucilaginibacter conchicola]RFZ90620.1 response regulator [Mucilaginibacter conchicola]
MSKILLLDDNPDIVGVVEEVLSYENHTVKSTQKSEGFLAIAQQFKPDVIMMDFKLDDGDGGELCRSLKEHPTLKYIPVIIFTAYNKPGLDYKSEYGCDGFIAKPFDIDVMLKTINEVISPKSEAFSA